MNIKLVVVLTFNIMCKLSYSLQWYSKIPIGKFNVVQNYTKGKMNHFAYLEGSSRWSARAIYSKLYKKTGWDILEVETSPEDSDELQAYAAGYIEGFLTWETIHVHYENAFYNHCENKEHLCFKIDEFLNQNFKWIKKMTRNRKKNAFWHHVKLVYKQIMGIYDGYIGAYTAEYSGNELSYADVMKFNFQWDICDLFQYLLKPEEEVWFERGERNQTAIIKLLANNSDIVIGHNTWNYYGVMIRMLKRYNLHYRIKPGSKKKAFGSSTAFSGYPGSISSMDDFYIMNSKLVTLQTSIHNTNTSLWRLIHPEVVLETVRSLAANRLAQNGKTWSKYFSTSNSGTNNKQWMIVDLNKFKPGKKPRAGLLYIIEQIPGLIRTKDQTLLFLNQTYWPSYNIPFYEDVFNRSGYRESGERYAYDKHPRALILKRDHSKVTDVESMMTLIRSNDYLNDPLSELNAEFALAARCDLNKDFNNFGAIDGKVMSSKWASTIQFKAVCGPPTGFNLPMFNWSTCNFLYVPHKNHPDSFKYKPIMTKWSYQ